MASSQTGQLAAEYSSVMTDNYCGLAATVVFLYDSIITTGEEIRCFWGRKITGAAILFWLNKYMTMLYLVSDLATFFNLSDKVCPPPLLGSNESTYILTSPEVSTSYPLISSSKSRYFDFPAFTAIRVYALRRSLTLCAITAGLSLAPLGTNFAIFRLGLTGKNIFPLGCTGFDNVSTTSLVTIISRSCVIAADCLAIGFTWFMLGLQYPAYRGGVLKGSIARVLLMDGAILAVLNSLHLAFTLLSINTDALEPTSVMTTFTFPLSAILVSRFLLHLQSASLRAVGSIPSSQISSLHFDRSLVFERVVGSLGASIAPADYLNEDHGDGDDGESADEPTQASRQ
ncbi:hypothetical protein BD310DRAFT_923811 [Dichomitus squalens]|uniref:DUF6533 domain-containing protein n=1 Tax=Dichomitus squalens TaxID=114155 RepID=A0A4Q9PZL8_9APHY|nr:hypothetical protein BD310DRAFT_923811 [Dichomitus squalens]